MQGGSVRETAGMGGDGGGVSHRYHAGRLSLGEFRL